MVKRNTKSTATKKVTTPYSDKYLAEEIKLCLTPLLQQKDVVKKWSSYIPDFIKETKQSLSYDKEHIEESLFMKVDRNTYKNLFKTIKDSVSILIGKLILQQYIISNREFEKLILAISDGLDELYRINKRLESWLYYDTGYTNSEDYADLCDTVSDVQEKFDNICENYNKMKFNIPNLKGDNFWALENIKEIYSIYKKLLKLSSKIFKLDIDERLYPYLDILEDFARNLANELIYTVGELYLLTDDLKNVLSKSKNKIEKDFKKLEEKQLRNQKGLDYLFYELNKNSSYGTKKDNELLYAYQELKAATNTMITDWKQ